MDIDRLAMRGEELQPARLYTSLELAARYGVCVRTVERWRIPRVRLGRCVRFRGCDVRAWEDEGRVEGRGGR